MYGELKLNAHHTIKYGLTLEFFHLFRHLKHCNIELAPTMMRHFHVWIQSFVDGHRHDRNMVSYIRNQSRLSDMSDVQTALARGSELLKDLSMEADRTTILLPIRYAHVAYAHFKRRKVIFMIRNPAEEELLNKLKLLPNFDVYRYHRAIRQTTIDREIRLRIRKQIKQMLSQSQHYHEIFHHPEFERWMLLKSIAHANIVEVLQRLILRHQVGVILELSEIVNPGTALALIARQYNIPFLNAPNMITADHALIPTRAAYHCAWGEHYKQWLQSRGIAEGKIVITGSVRYEQEVNKPPKLVDQQALLLAHGIQMKSHEPLPYIFTYTTQPYDHEVQRTTMQWIRYVATLPFPFIFIIRPHPADRFQYSHYLSSKIILSPQTIDLYDLLRHSDAVLTICSNTAFEAAQLQKGIIVLQPHIPYHFTLNYNDYHKLLVHGNAGPVVKNAKDLQKIIRRAVTNKSYLNSISKQAQICLQRSVQTEKSPALLMGRLINRLLTSKR